jgi:capping protein beta
MEAVTCGLNIMRRMPPSKIEHNLAGLLNLVDDDEDTVEELLQRVDQPLQIEKDTTTGKSFLLCDYNRDGDSYRSPWSNTYFPAIDDGFVPSDRLRELEEQANSVFDAYRKLYFEGGLSSVYLWDLEEGKSFAGCFLIKKSTESGRYVKSGCWDSIHVVEVNEEEGGAKANYKLTTTVMLSMAVTREAVGDVDLSGSLTRQATNRMSLDSDNGHISNIGKMIEEMETNIRGRLDELYIKKTQQIINGMRKTNPGDDDRKALFINQMNSAVIFRNCFK